MTQRRSFISGLAIILSIFLAIGAWFAISQGTAGAHAVQIGSDPAPNEELLDPPTRITINFSEPLEPSVTSIQLWDTTPEEIAISDPSHTSEDTATVDILQELEPGIYTVIWRNLSTVDAHTWAGSFSFTVLNPDGTTPAGEVPESLLELAQAPSNTPSTLETTARWIVLLGSAVMLGGVAYVALVVLPATRTLSGDSRDSVRKLSLNVLLATTVLAVFLVLHGSLIQLLIQADALGGLSNVNELLTETRFGEYLIARQALLAVTLVAVILAWRSRGPLLYPALAALAVAAFGVLFTQSMVSHAAGTDGAFWKVSTDVLHFLAAAVWIGALIHIAFSMPRWLETLSGPARTLFTAASFRNFSILAAFSVLVLMISGVVSAFAQFTSLGQLFDTNYGRALVAKMALMLPLLGVAGLNAFWLQPRIVAAGLQVRGGAGDDTDHTPVASLHQRLVNLVRLEALLGVLVLVAVGALIQLEPARAQAEADAAAGASDITSADPLAAERGYFLRASQVGGLVVSLKVDPAQVGSNLFEVGLGSEFGFVGEVLDVRIDFDHADPDVGGSRLELPLSGSQRFSLDATNLSLPGEWSVAVTVQRRGEDDITATFDLPLGLADPGESSIWNWPFDGLRTTGVIITLMIGAFGVVAVLIWQRRNLGAMP